MTSRALVNPFRGAGVTLRALLLVSSSGLAGLACSGGSQLTYHAPEAVISRKALPVAVLGDVDIIDDVIGDTVLVDVGKNKSYGSLILNHADELLRARKFGVQNLVLTSVGLIMDRNQIYRYSGSVTAGRGDFVYGRAPFYLDDVIANDSPFVGRLASTYRTLLTVPVGTLAAGSFRPFSDSMGTRFQGEMLICFILGGYMVSASDRVMARPEPLPYGKGLETESKVTQVSLTMFILDAREGTLLWSDQLAEKGGNVSTNKLLYLTEQLIDRLPDL